MTKTKAKASDIDVNEYELESQIGFLIRTASQRHVSIFSKSMPHNLTTTQFSMLVKLSQLGSCSQNRLGLMIAVDIVTTKSVVGRLRDNGYINIEPDKVDKRRLLLSLTKRGKDIIQEALPIAKEVTAKTVKQLTEKEVATLSKLLMKIG